MAGLLTTFRKTPINWSAGTLYSPDCNLFKVTIKDATPSPIDLRGEADAINTGTNPKTDTAVFEAVEVILRELNPDAYFTVNDASGVMYLVMPKSINSASELRTRIRQIGATDTVTVKTAGSFVVGDEYTITTTGTTNFTLVGATDSNEGTVFTATGVGSGTGEATATDRVTDIGPNNIDISGSVVETATGMTFTV